MGMGGGGPKEMVCRVLGMTSLGYFIQIIVFGVLLGDEETESFGEDSDTELLGLYVGINYLMLLFGFMVVFLMYLIVKCCNGSPMVCRRIM